MSLCLVQDGKMGGAVEAPEQKLPGRCNRILLTAGAEISLKTHTLTVLWISTH